MEPSGRTTGSSALGLRKYTRLALPLSVKRPATSTPPHMTTPEPWLPIGKSTVKNDFRCMA